MPETTIGAAPAATTTSTSASFGFTSSEAGASFTCRLDAGAWTACASPQPYAGLAIGAHTFAVRATDSDGNTDASPATHTWTIESPADTQPPQTTIGTGPADPTTATTASVTFTSDEPGGTFRCRVDLGPWTGCTSPATYASVTTGLHTFEVQAIDAAGNIDPTSAFHQWYVRATTAASCGTAQTLIATADAWIDQKSPTSNKGTDSTLKVQSKSGNNNFRAFVKFGAPTVPAGCVVDTATLRLWNDAPKSGRTIQAIGVTAAWTEGGVTWNNQPAALGSTATVPSGSAKGWREWTVTQHVAAMVAGSSHEGFLIKDATENQTSNEQQFFGREKGGADRPQLVVRFVPAPADTVAPETTVTGGPTGPTTATSATFTFTSSEPGGTFECSLDGAAFQPLQRRHGDLRRGCPQDRTSSRSGLATSPATATCCRPAASGRWARCSRAGSRSQRSCSSPWPSWSPWSWRSTATGRTPRPEARRRLPPASWRPTERT